MNLSDLLRPQIVVKPHQWESRDFLLSNRHCYNLSQMGTGKTLPAVLALRELYAHQAAKRILIVAPLSVIGCVWGDHMRDFAPEVPRLLLNQAAKRGKLMGTASDGAILTNPDGVISLCNALHTWRPDLIIIDEISGYYRNMRTQRWAAMSGIINKFRVPVWALTGTPVPKGLMDSYAQLAMVTPWTLPTRRSGGFVRFTALRDMLHTQPYPNVYVPKPGALERVFAMMQPAVRFTRAQVMSELDEPVRLRRQIELSKEQKKMLADLEVNGKAAYGDATVKGADAHALATKIVQISCGAVYADENKIAYPPAAARMEAVKQILDEANSPVILAVPFIHVAHLLRDIGTEKGLRIGMIIGETKPNERTDIVRSFQNGELDILICHPKTAAHGLTLTRSHTVVWFAPLYDLELYAQLNDRISRFGQTEKPCIVELFSTPLEAKIYDCVRRKETLQGKFLDFFEGDN